MFLIHINVIKFNFKFTLGLYIKKYLYIYRVLLNLFFKNNSYNYLVIPDID